MPNTFFGANDLSIEELEELFADDQQETPPATEQNPQLNGNVTNTGNDGGTNNIDTTKAFSRRLRESTEKARKEERESIAKSLGYESYDALQKDKEKRLLTDKGLDSDDVAPVIEQLVQERIDSDPRMQELSNFRAQKEKEFAKKELEEIKQLTDGEITSFSQLSPAVINAWKSTGSLTKAYLQEEGVNLLTKIKNKPSSTSSGTEHLNTPSGTVASTPTERLLTDEEKDMWRKFFPNISTEELNKKTVKI